MTLTRRQLTSTALILATGATLPAAETAPRMIRITYTWPDGAKSVTSVPESTLRGRQRPYRCAFPVMGGMLVGEEG